MNKENCALELVDEIILYYDARSKKHQIVFTCSLYDRIQSDYSYAPHNDVSVNDGPHI